MYKKICMCIAVALSSSTQNMCSLSGKLDTTFNAGGIQPGTVSTNIANSTTDALGNSVAIQPDGKIVVAGFATIGGVNQFAVARFNADGSLDTTFNAGGAEPGTVATIVDNGTDSQGRSVAIQPDGKIVVAGFTLVAGVRRFGVARFNANGTLDTTFNPLGVPPGTVSTIVDNGTVNEGNSVVIQSDGKIVVAGTALVAGVNHFGVARFNTDGSLDTTFNPLGVPPGTVSTTVDNGTNNQGFSVALQQDGRIVVAGFAVVAGVTGFGVARFNIDGSLDTTFNPLGGQPGTVSTTIDHSTVANVGHAVLIQPDGKIVIAGVTIIGTVPKFAVARFTTNGALDTSFNALGIQPGTVSTTVENSTDSQGLAGALQSDGKIVVAGQVQVNGLKFGVARFNVNGTLDTTFNLSGIQPGTVSTTIDNNVDGNAGQAVAIQRDGKIVVAGSTFNGANNRFAVARFFGVATNNLCALRLIEKYGPRLAAQL